MNLIKVLLKASVSVLRTFFSKSGSCCRVLIAGLVLLGCNQTASGQRMMKLNEVLDSALAFSPVLKASQAGITQQKQLLKSSFNLPNPEILIQNPTGHFYTAGVQQNFDFPTVYGVQRSLQRSNVKLAENSYKLTASELKYQVAVLYIELQLQTVLYNLYKRQDTVFSMMSKSAEVLFKAGQIDYVQQSFTRLQAGDIRNNLGLAEATVEGLKLRLKAICGIRGDFRIDSLYGDPAGTIKQLSDSGTLANPLLRYNEQLLLVREKELKLARQRVIPGFTVAYLNQGEKNTSLQNRFYAGIRVPLWFWQYSGSISAAKSHLEARRQENYASSISINAEFEDAMIRHRAYESALKNYNIQMLADIEGILSASPRLLKAGSKSYLEHLKITADALAIQRSYWETLRSFRQSEIYISYLSGTL